MDITTYRTVYIMPSLFATVGVLLTPPELLLLLGGRTMPAPIAIRGVVPMGVRRPDTGGISASRGRGGRRAYPSSPSLWLPARERVCPCGRIGPGLRGVYDDDALLYVERCAEELD